MIIYKTFSKLKFSSCIAALYQLFLSEKFKKVLKMELLESRDFSREFTFSASRSGGPGGQHVNKVNTRVELGYLVHDSALNTVKEEQIYPIDYYRSS